MKPKYPVYIPSKSRSDNPLSIHAFDKDGVDIKIVVEPAEVKNYEKFGKERLLVLPENGRGLVYARNWIKDYSRANGEARHWQFDDDIRGMTRIYRGFKIPVSIADALAISEEFVERYENVALASFNSEFFVPTTGIFSNHYPPFYLNARCYTCFLMLNSLPNRWRNRYNEDTDMTLQVLADGWCTILFNAFLIITPTTMTHKGGQTGIYVNDGRLRMARELERTWPGVVTVKRKFKRPQHHVKDLWKKFDTPLKMKASVDLKAMRPDEHGLKLQAVRPVKSGNLRKLLQ